MTRSDLLTICERGCGRQDCAGCQVAAELMAEEDKGAEGGGGLSDLLYDCVVLGGLALVIWALAVM